jgi:hypothetical protein
VALRYFVDPHDQKNDRIPEIGFNDDLAALQRVARDAPRRQALEPPATEPLDMLAPSQECRAAEAKQPYPHAATG